MTEAYLGSLSLAGKLQKLSQLGIIGAADEKVWRWSRAVLGHVPRRYARSANALALGLAVRERVRYVGEHPQAFADPGLVLELGSGNCAESSALLAAVLMRARFPVRWGIGWDNRGRAVHVWPRALVMVNGGSRWIDLDPSTYKVAMGDSPIGVGGVVRGTEHPLAY